MTEAIDKAETVGRLREAMHHVNEALRLVASAQQWSAEILQHGNLTRERPAVRRWAIDLEEEAERLLNM